MFKQIKRRRLLKAILSDKMMKMVKQQNVRVVVLDKDKFQDKWAGGNTDVRSFGFSIMFDKKKRVLYFDESQLDINAKSYTRSSVAYGLIQHDGGFDGWYDFL